MQLAANVVIVGPNGLGKIMLAKNLLHRAVLRGHTARFTLASDMLHDLASQDSSTQLARRLRHYTRPALLCIDEVGYLSYDARYADLLFEVITRRYQQRATVLTTNKPFGEWNQVFPTPPASSRSSTGSCTDPRSSLSRGKAIGSRKHRNALHSGNRRRPGRLDKHAEVAPGAHTPAVGLACKKSASHRQNRADLRSR